MSQVIGRERLKCPFCPSTRFVRVVHINWGAKSGTADEPAGLRCAECSVEVDVAMMLKSKERDRKMAELRELQEELGERRPHPQDLDKEPVYAASTGNPIPVQEGHKAAPSVQPKRAGG